MSQTCRMRTHFIAAGDGLGLAREVLPHKISLLLSVDTGQMDRAFALDKTDHLRDRKFRWS
jgi:hypothetical protein